MPESTRAPPSAQARCRATLPSKSTRSSRSADVFGLAMKAQGPRARLIDRIADVSAADWDKLANPQGTEFNPFLSHAFLKALEDSESVTTEAGWRPAHALLEDGKTIVGAAPMYVKSHSYGEYVFDHQ